MINTANIGESMILTPYTAKSVIPTINHVGKVIRGLKHMHIVITSLNDFDIAYPFTYRFALLFDGLPNVYHDLRYLNLEGDHVLPHCDERIHRHHKLRCPNLEVGHVLRH